MSCRINYSEIMDWVLDNRILDRKIDSCEILSSFFIFPCLRTM